MTNAGHKWKTSDTIYIKRIGEVNVSPDGNRLAFTVVQAILNLEKSDWRSQVFIADSSGRPPGQLTRGGHSAYSPQWSPDGQSVSFMTQNNIWRMPLPEGKARQVTDVAAGVSSYKWSPDGTMIAFTARDDPLRKGMRSQGQAGEPRIVNNGDDNHMLHKLSLGDCSNSPASGRRLTGCDMNIGSPEIHQAYTWSPDCKTIYFSHSRSTRPNDWPGTRTSLLNLRDGSMRPFEFNDRVIFDPCISPDGCWLACKIYDDPPWEWSSVLHLFPMAGGPSKQLADTYDHRPDLLGWSADGRRLFFLESHGTCMRLCALSVNGSSAEILFEPDGCIENASLNRSGSTLGFTLQTTRQPPEVYITPLDKIKPRQLSHFNDAPDRASLGNTEVIRWKSVDGIEIEGLLTLPLAYKKGERLPLIVCAHGGPADAWRQFFIGLQSFYGPIGAFTAQGYAILRCNVRGSTGYGKVFRQGNFRDWGGKDIQDLLTGVDHVLNLGIADPERMGILGWSFGGYLTAATITRTTRFKAAVIGDGVTDLVSYALGHDSPGFMTSHFGGEIWEVADLLLERSPIVHANRVTTPTLILHGELDERVPVWQGREFHHALLRLGCPTQMVIYPRMGHTPSDPATLQDIMDRIMEWMKRYLGKRRL